MSFSLSEYTKIGGAYSARSDFLAGFKGAASRQERNGGERREVLGEEKRGREGKGGMGKGREKGEVGGIAPWLLRG